MPKVQRVRTPNRQAVKVFYDNGDTIHFALTSTKDSLVVNQPRNDPKSTEAQSKAIMRKFTPIVVANPDMEVAIDRISELMASTSTVEELAREQL